MVKRANSINWERIELEYLTGEVSIREIADRYEVSEAAIRRRAKVNNWVRAQKSAQKVRTPAHCALSAPAVPPPPSNPDEPRDLTSISDQARNLIGRMLDELDAVTSHPGELEEIINASTQDDDDDTRRNTLMKAVSLPSRASVLKTLALSLKATNEASAPQGKKAAKQEKANELAGRSRFSPIGAPTLKAVK